MPTQKLQKKYLLGAIKKLDNEENKTEGMKGTHMQIAAIKDMVKPCLKSTCRNFEIYISEFKLPLWSRPSLITKYFYKEIRKSDRSSSPEIYK